MVTFRALPLLFLLLAAWSLPASAVDGVVEVNQTSAVAGIGVGGDVAGFPVTLDVAGSYRLTGNLQATTGSVDLASIEASDVSLDLNGFALLGATVCSEAAEPTYVSCIAGGSSARGVAVASGLSAVRISNGAISGMTAGGIEVSGASIVVEGVTVRSNGGLGIIADEGDVSNCSAVLNGSAGFVMNAEGRYRNVFAKRNGGSGIVSFGAGRIENGSSHENASHEIQVGAGSVVIGAQTTLNATHGFTTSGPAIVRNLASVANTQSGILGGAGSLIEDSVATNNQFDGIGCIINCVIRNNVASLNTGGGTSTDGIDAGSEAVVLGNTANSNQGTGLRLGTGSLYDHNHMRSNGTNVSGGVSMGANLCDTTQC